MSLRPLTFADIIDTEYEASEGQDVHTFSNGTDWECWASGNCFQCRYWDEDKAGALCAFECAASLHSVSPKLAALFGWTHNEKYGPRDGWHAPDRCAFFSPRTDNDGNDIPLPPEPDPLQLNLLADPTEDAARLFASAPERQEVC